MNSIFEITHDGKKELYYSENFGDFKEVLYLLRGVKQAKSISPTIDEVSWLLKTFDKAHGLRPMCFTENARLFKRYDQADLQQQIKSIYNGATDLRHIVLDFDNNQFDFTEWQGENLATISTPLQEAILSYTKSIRKMNANTRYINEDAYKEAFDKITTTTIHDTESLDTEEQGMSMKL